MDLVCSEIGAVRVLAWRNRARLARFADALDYLRGMQENEPLRPIDINALLQSLAEDARLLGREMTIEGSAQTPFIGHLTGLRRALQNLVDNAVKYGQRAHVRVEDGTEFLLLVVDDEGRRPVLVARHMPELDCVLALDIAMREPERIAGDILNVLAHTLRSG